MLNIHLQWNLFYSHTTLVSNILIKKKKKKKGYLDITSCSTYEKHNTHLKLPVLIRQIYKNNNMHNSLKVSSCHVTPRPYVLDQGSIPNFHMDLTWRQNVSRCRDLPRNTRHCSIFKLKICFAHCIFKLRNARHTRLSFSVNCRTCLNFAVCVSPRNEIVRLL